MNLEFYDISNLSLYYIFATISGYVLGSVKAKNARFGSHRRRIKILSFREALYQEIFTF